MECLQTQDASQSQVWNLWIEAAIRSRTPHGRKERNPWQGPLGQGAKEPYADPARWAGPHGCGAALARRLLALAVNPLQQRVLRALHRQRA